MSLLRIVYSYILSGASHPESQQLEQLVQLLQDTWDLQSEPAEKADKVLGSLRSLKDLKTVLIEIRQQFGGGLMLSSQSLIVLSLVATFKWLLRDEAYVPILEAFPALSKEMKRFSGLLDRAPLVEALDHLGRNWDQVRRETALELSAITCVRACGRSGIFAESEIYKKIAERLEFDAGFLVVIVAAACFKVPAIASRVDLGEWNDTQYACLRILDHFAELGDTAWG
jgi:hypothetical protein